MYLLGLKCHFLHAVGVILTETAQEREELESVERYLWFAIGIPLVTRDFFPFLFNFPVTDMAVSDTDNGNYH